MNTLFIGDKSIFSLEASRIIDKLSTQFHCFFWSYGDNDNSVINIDSWEGDWIFSFKSDLILPLNLINKAKKGAINIHPSIPKYRGIGGYTYAILNRDREYGVTAHWMVERLDWGKIIKVKRFPIYSFDSPETLSIRASLNCIILLCDILDMIIKEHRLPESNETWSKKLYTRKDLVKTVANNDCKI